MPLDYQQYCRREVAARAIFTLTRPSSPMHAHAATRMKAPRRTLFSFPISVTAFYSHERVMSAWFLDKGRLFG